MAPTYWLTWLGFGALRSIGLCETANTWWGGDREVRDLAIVEGLQHLDAALARGRGVILIGGHFTTIEIATRILGTVVPLNVVYRPTKNALFSRTMCNGFAGRQRRMISFCHGHHHGCGGAGQGERVQRNENSSSTRVIHRHRLRRRG